VSRHDRAIREIVSQIRALAYHTCRLEITPGATEKALTHGAISIISDNIAKALSNLLALEVGASGGDSPGRLTPTEDQETRESAQQKARELWEKFGVTHDPRVYACRLCKIPCRWEHDHVTIGYSRKLCGLCLAKQEADEKTRISRIVDELDEARANLREARIEARRTRALTLTECVAVTREVMETFCNVPQCHGKQTAREIFDRLNMRLEVTTAGLSKDGIAL